MDTASKQRSLQSCMIPLDTENTSRTSLLQQCYCNALLRKEYNLLFQQKRHMIQKGIRCKRMNQDWRFDPLSTKYMMLTQPED